jgi:hypothetical protein
VKIAQRVTTEIAPFFLILGKAQGANKDLLDEVVFPGDPASTADRTSAASGEVAVAWAVV